MADEKRKRKFIGRYSNLINMLKGEKPMEDKQNSEEEKPDEENQQKFDENGNLFIKLTIDDSALVVRSNGTIELVSHELENTQEGYVGDIEDLNKTFSLVLALASALENEELYHRMFHNLNMVLMKKWDNMPEDIKKDIIEKRNETDEQRTPEEEEEKQKRIEEFKKKMNKHKERFLDDLEAERKKIRRDLMDEENFMRKYSKENPLDPFSDVGGMMEEQKAHFEHLEKMKEKRKKKTKKNSLAYLKGIDWNPYDKSLKTHGFDYRLDVPPPDDDEDE